MWGFSFLHYKFNKKYGYSLIATKKLEFKIVCLVERLLFVVGIQFVLENVTELTFKSMLPFHW